MQVSVEWISFLETGFLQSKSHYLTLSCPLLCHIVMQPGVPHEDTNAMLLEASEHQNYEPNKPLYFINCSISGILLYQHKQLVQDHTLKLPALQNRPLVLSESFPDCLTPFLLTKSLVLPLKKN